MSLRDEQHVTRRAPEGRRALLGELQRFLLSGEPFPAAAWVRHRELVPALITYLRVGRAFRRKGLSEALQLIPPVAPRPERATESPATAFCARAAAWRLVGLARTLAGRHLCLHESLGVCAALRKLGFPVQVVIGYPVIELADGDEELHAWPALGNTPLTGRSRSSPLGYLELYRYPEGAGAQERVRRADAARAGKVVSPARVGAIAEAAPCC
ncbi:lasso peptide biosynthesis protein [Sorangium sp. So ce1099]|uniref:lasso peptide biosynthesis protein n=1 Tax=Sorangium sp. So ce1099 TaxID=3133331 RepID=UPI003F5E6D6F